MSFDFTRSKKNSYSLVHTSILSHSCPICGPVTKRSSLHFVCLTWLWIWIRVKWIERNEHLFIVLIWSISFKFSFSYAAFIPIVTISSILLYQWSSRLKHTHCSHNIWSFNNVESSIFTADKCERQSAHNEPSYSCVHTLARASHNVIGRMPDNFHNCDVRIELCVRIETFPALNYIFKSTKQSTKNGIFQYLTIPFVFRLCERSHMRTHIGLKRRKRRRNNNDNSNKKRNCKPKAIIII